MSYETAHGAASAHPTGNLLAHLNRAAIETAYSQASGGGAGSGKFLSPQSSAALAANTFGLFFDAPRRLPPFPGLERLAWPALEVRPEAVLRFPGRGGRHPCLDVAVFAPDALIGVESRRYEPFRPMKAPELTRAYRRDVWGSRMRGYQAIRDLLGEDSSAFRRLDAAKLVQHALGLREAARRQAVTPLLIYLYAEPEAWPEGAPIPQEAIARHRQEIDYFASRVRGDEVRFVPLTYRELLATWEAELDPLVRAHARAVRDHFHPGHSEPLWRNG